ncbi:MAG TPA: hypothetical protein VF150_07715 [Thermoanaerobaculia bacterium]
MPDDRSRRPTLLPPILPSLTLALALALSLGSPGPAAGQAVIDVQDDLDFDRPEAWAMKWFASSTLFTGLGAPRDRQPWELEVGLEGGWLPSLSEEERRVGFDGEKVEDLNRSDVFGRVRATLGLPGRFSLSAGWVPPVEIDGLEPSLLSVALSRPLAEGRSWRLGGRLHATGGEVEGDITCDRATVAAGDDPVANPFGCLEPSRDEVTLRTWGAELSIAWPLSRTEPYLAAGGNWHDHEFQVDALYTGVRDRTLLLADGFTWHAAGGLSWSPGERTRLAGEVFYSPLDVERPPERESENDELLNVRLLLSWRLR